MSPLLEMGRAGLGLLSLLFVMALLVLLLGRPAVGTAPFVTTGAVLLVAMRRAVHSRRTIPDPNEGEHHA